ncbi:MFS transporter [Shinella sp. HZN7]|uniref:L-proline/glycine betaine transporter prop n=2 Tax=Brucella/Ochrobactrum group TaxID=2826938 RepID=A0A075XFG3_9HYPH|nr:MFS transporter [Shinella sp. HZN7]AIH15769.1 l-proline/glycine betaine transporter prop [Ochrobactrum sp. SJY1]
MSVDVGSSDAGIQVQTVGRSPGLGNVLRRKSLVATGLGNTLEWYDWTIYAVFAPYIAKAMFDTQDPVSALLSTLAIFAVGFISRPLGGIVFGALADRLGRRSVLLTSMVLMGFGSLLIAVSPTYAAIGGFASLIVLAARLLQGFAHGGEATASYAYLAEIAPKERRGLWTSSMFFSVGIGSIVATLLGVVLTRVIDAVDMDSWGWRIPFLLGALLSVLVLFLRKSMMESDVLTDFVGSKGEGSPNPVETSDWPRSKIISRAVGIFFYQAGVGLPYYLWTAYAAVFAITQRGMDPSGAFTASLFAQIPYIIAVPVWGYVSDRIGRKPVTIFYFLSVAVLTFPLISFISSEPWTLFVAQGVMLSVTGCIGGTLPAIIAERVPTRYRSRIMGISLPLSLALFGGTAPYLSSWFSSQQLSWVFNLYVVIVVLIAAGVVATWKETRGIDLRDVN